MLLYVIGALFAMFCFGLAGIILYLNDPRRKELSEAERAETLLTAIVYTLEGPNQGYEAVEWLNRWSYGHQDAMQELEDWRKQRHAGLPAAFQGAGR